MVLSNSTKPEQEVGLEQAPTRRGHRSGPARTHSRVPRCPLRGEYANATSCFQTEPLPEWMDLKTTQTYICASERTLREWVHRDIDPLPAVQDGGKIYISRTRLDRWMLNHPVTSEKTDVEAIVNEVMGSIGGSR